MAPSNSRSLVPCPGSPLVDPPLPLRCSVHVPFARFLPLCVFLSLMVCGLPFLIGRVPTVTPDLPNRPSRISMPPVSLAVHLFVCAWCVCRMQVKEVSVSPRVFAFLTPPNRPARSRPTQSRPRAFPRRRVLSDSLTLCTTELANISHVRILCTTALAWKNALGCQRQNPPHRSSGASIVVFEREHSDYPVSVHDPSRRGPRNALLPRRRSRDMEYTLPLVVLIKPPLPVCHWPYV